MEIALLILEIVGTVAFSVSGALVSIKAKLDLFGVILLGCMTAFGGGIMRDVIIGVIPPTIFSRYYMVLIAIAVSIIVFIISYIHRDKFIEFKKKIDHINNLFDAIGLGAFTVMGTEAAFAHGFGDKVFLSLTLGLLTGVGGGVIRDVLVNDTPYILRKHVYALISITGGVIYYLLRRFADNTAVCIIIPVVTIVILRVLAARYRWSLPKIHISDEENT